MADVQCPDPGVPTSCSASLSPTAASSGSRTAPTTSPAGTGSPGEAIDGRLRIAYLRSTPTEPPDLFWLDGRSQPRRLTEFNRDVLADIELRPALERHVTVDGRDIQGWFIPGGDGTTARPLVLEIHGGPHTLYGWSPVWEFQVLAGAGIGVFYSNPRGSEGYGEAFNDANHRDWGPGPTRDVLAGVESLVADGLADPDRLGVTGGSYGGYLTNWIVAHDHRFRAAMTCRCVADMGMLFLTGDIGGGEWAKLEFDVDALGRPGLLPRDLAGDLRGPDHDAAAHPALRARHPHDRSARPRRSSRSCARSRRPSASCACPTRPTS